MQYKETDLNQKNNEAALASQEQVLPLVRELNDAELDFVAGGASSTLDRGIDKSTVRRYTGPSTTAGALQYNSGAISTAGVLPNYESHAPQKKRHSCGGHAK